MEGSSHAKNQLDSFVRFGRTPTCDGQTDRHRPTASTADAQHRAVKSSDTADGPRDATRRFSGNDTGAQNPEQIENGVTQLTVHRRLMNYMSTATTFRTSWCDPQVRPSTSFDNTVDMPSKNFHKSTLWDKVIEGSTGTVRLFWTYQNFHAVYNVR